MSLLVTGCAGFIGYHTARALLERGEEVFGLDNLNDYYDPQLKCARLAELARHPRFQFERIDIADAAAVERAFARGGFRRVIHLAAQAGVRYSLKNPQVYVESNLVGFANLIESCRRHSIEHFVYASTSSVYGANTTMPFSERAGVDHPLTLYAATKRANELMAHSYSSLYGLPTTGLRFFTVYGPWGRPDMALFLFTEKILAGKPIDVYAEGEHQRDFTYIDDVVAGVVAVSDRPAKPDPTWDSSRPEPNNSAAPYKIYNIGNERPVALTRYIEVLEDCLGRRAHKNFMPLQPGDVPNTWADVSSLEHDVGYRPRTELEVGVKRFVEWYMEYYRPRPS